jgi:hypothetical protein
MEHGINHVSIFDGVHFQSHITLPNRRASQLFLFLKLARMLSYRGLLKRNNLRLPFKYLRFRYRQNSIHLTLFKTQEDADNLLLVLQLTRLDRGKVGNPISELHPRVSPQCSRPNPYQIRLTPDSPPSNQSKPTC